MTVNSKKADRPGPAGSIKEVTLGQSVTPSSNAGYAVFELTTCPSEDKLRKHLLGKIFGEAAKQLDAHFVSCPECLKTADEIMLTDDLVAQMQLVRDVAPAPPEVSVIIDEVLSGSGRDDTVHGGTTPTKRDSHSEPILTELSQISADEAFAPLRDAMRISADGYEVQLGVYRILEVIGSGGMGIVFRAEDTRLQRPVALKFMRPHLAADSRERKRFLREARSAASIRHDHVAMVFHVDEVNGIPYIAMPLLDGETLKRRLTREGRIPEAEVLRIGMQIASGLEAAHSAGLIHRDIKPDNIWLEAPDQRVKILDFGLATPTQDDAELTVAGMIIGTPRYMAPEQASTMPVDHRCDLFSLGSVLYRAVTGHSPFSGDSAMECVAAVMKEPVRPAHTVTHRVSKDLSGVLSRLLMKNPDDRIQTAAAVATSLAAIGGNAGNGKGRSWNRILGGIVGGAAILLLLGVIVIRVTNKDGSVSEYRFPDGNDVAIDLSDASDTVNVTVKMPTGDTNRLTPPPTDNHHRHPNHGAVESLLQAGATVSARDSQFERYPIHSADDLQQKQWVSKVLWYGRKPIPATFFKTLKSVQTLKELEVTNTRLEQEDWQDIGQIKTLEYLKVNNCAITAAHVRHIKSLTNLHHLNIYDTDIDHDGFRALTEVLKAKILTLGGPHLRDEHLASLVASDAIKFLTIFDAPRVSDQGLTQLTSITNLKQLDLLRLPKVSEKGVRALTERSLERLSLTDVPGVTSNMPWFANMTTLQDLCIGPLDDRIPDEDFRSLQRLRQLKRLELFDYQLTALEFETIANLPKLRHLSCDASTLTNETIAAIASLRHLETLVLKGEQPSADKMAALQKTIPNCQIIYN